MLSCDMIYYIIIGRFIPIVLLPRYNMTKHITIMCLYRQCERCVQAIGCIHYSITVTSVWFVCDEFNFSAKHIIILY